MHHAAAHKALKHFQETEEASKHFIAIMKHKVMGNNPMKSLTWAKCPFLIPTIQAR